MLSQEDNELLTRTGPGTPMGRVMRRHWIPALLSEDLPEPDGRPFRARLLGEDLIAFRDTTGAVGLVGEHCPHRGVSLYFSRNEHEGLRCVYHGWKFDRHGRCVDMPNERPDSGLKGTIRLRSYPCVEKAGLVWTYMGEGTPPALPDLEWMSLAPQHVHVSLRVQECNWLQAFEGEMDPSHAPILHSRIDGKGGGPDTYAGMSEKWPHLEIVETDAGVQIGSRRDAGERYYWRVNHFLMPFWSVVPPGAGEVDINGHAWVPMDDTTTLCVMYSYNPGEPISERRLKLFREGHRGREPGHMSANGALAFDPSKPYGKYWPKWNRQNDYGMDWEAQKTKYFSGLAGLWVQDSGCQESMGAIVDRTQEHLCSADAALMRVRRVLRAAAQSSGPHPSVNDPSVYRKRAVSVLLPKDMPWLEGVEEHIHDRGPIRSTAVAAE